jgi:RNA polymerase sigma-70 factor (ECF subfamily)
MAETPEHNSDVAGQPRSVAAADMSATDAWFIREVLPLESILVQFLRRNWSNASDIADLRQEVYVLVYEAAARRIPDPARPFILTTARNLIINRVRREQIIPIEVVADLETLGVAADAPGPDRAAASREALRRVQEALDHLPPRSRDVVMFKQIDGLSRSEIAARMGISSETVKWHLAQGMRALADTLYGELMDLRKKP